MTKKITRTSILIAITAALFFQATVYSQDSERSNLKYFELRSEKTSGTLLYREINERTEKRYEISRTSFNRGINEGLRELFEISEENYEFRNRVFHDTVIRRVCKYGFQHERFRQYYKNIKIENSDIRVRFKDGEIVGANGYYINVPAIDITVRLSKEDAISIAKRYVGARKYIWEDEAEKAIL